MSIVISSAKGRSAQSSRWGHERGLTLLEVIVALAVIAIIGAVFVTNVLSNLRHTTTAGERTQAAQVLNFLGRLAAGGDGDVLPALGSSEEWDYGELVGAFPDISGGDGFGDASRYRAGITAVGILEFAGAETVQYDISVCFQVPDGESCIVGTTLGAQAPGNQGTAPLPLPGIN